MKDTTILLLAASCFLNLAPGTATSQQSTPFHELGAFGIAAWSDHPELSDSRGFGAAAAWEFGGIFMARVSFHRISNDSNKEGIVCDQYSQRINCRSEMTETSTRLSGLRGALMGMVALGDRLRIGAGGGPSFNHVRAESVGAESGMDADLLTPNAGVIGVSAFFTLGLMPFPGVPVRINGGFGYHWLNFDTCSANEPPQYDPYCDPDSFRELEIGASYSF